MKHLIKKWVARLTAVSLVIPTVFAFSGCGSSKDPDVFTIWMGSNVGVMENYKDYSENPVIKYLEYKFNIKFEFIVPPSGSEADNFTTTTISGDKLPDVMELSYYSGATVDLVTDRIAVDLTDYIYPSEGESLLPYTKAFLDANPDVKDDVRTIDNHYYALYTVTDPEGNPPWGGYLYRRDLLLKYASEEDSFTLDGKTINPAAWSDGSDVVFPSGANAPDLISDYDWLFKILKRAQDAGELNYVTTLYYPGYLETGDLVSAFGTVPTCYKVVENGKTVVKYGGDSDEFKAYIAKMKEWYDAGYIDKNFTTHTNDMFFSIDSESYAVGKVGCFYGMTGFLGDAISVASGGVAPATMDLRASYMPRLSKDMEPIGFYKDTKISRSWMVTTSAMNKNYEKLFAALDYLYSPEGSLLVNAGLNWEQYAEMIDAGVTGFWDTTVALNEEEQAILGISETSAKLSEVGAYYYNERVGANLFWQDIETNPSHGSTIVSASAQIFWGNNGTGKTKRIYDSEAIHEAQYEIWSKYVPTANISTSITAKLTTEQNADYVINYKALSNYLATEVPKFITGAKSLDDDWKSFCNNQQLKGSAKNVNYLQEVYNALENN